MSWAPRRTATGPSSIRPDPTRSGCVDPRPEATHRRPKGAAPTNLILRHHPTARRGPSAQGELAGHEGRGQCGVTHDPTVDARRARASFGDGPHDEALPTGHVAAHEHALAIRLPVGVAGHAPSGIDVE